MTAASSIARLQAIADALVRGGDPWFAQCLARLEAGAGLEAFGLVGSWRALARERRDKMIREIAAERFPGRSGRAIARIVMRRSDLRAEIGGRISEEIIRRALRRVLARAPTSNAPDLDAGSTVYDNYTLATTSRYD